MMIGAVVFAVAQTGLLTHMTRTTILSAGTMIRMLMPGTLIEAARKLGLNGPVVAGALYLVLLVGMVTFLSALALH